MLQDVCQCPDSWWNEVTRLQLPEVLDGAVNETINGEKGDERTSCQSHNSTDPGFSRPFVQAAEFVRSRHRASTTLPFFSLETCKGRVVGYQNLDRA